MRRYSKTIIALSIIPQIIAVKILALFPGFIETYYSNGFYAFVSKTFRYVFGWLPFSAGDIIYTIAIIYLVRWLIKNRWRIVKDTKYWIRDVFAAVSLSYFTFHLFWGMNYYRIPLHESLHIKNTYTTEELLEAVATLTEYSNKAHASVVAHDTLKVTMPYTKQELLYKSTEGYKVLASEFPQFDPAPKSVKRSLFSLPLTYMGFSGYMNPFTNEAHIDGLIPLHKYPTTACHEQAHQIGYAAENETNFIGCIAAIANKDPYFKYSGYMFALKHCLFELRNRDPEAFEVQLTKINKGILKNYQEEYEFWSSYQNPLEPFFKDTYGTFLKANNQDKGIESYSYVVALLVNHFNNEAFR